MRPINHSEYLLGCSAVVHREKAEMGSELIAVLNLFGVISENNAFMVLCAIFKTRKRSVLGMQCSFWKHFQNKIFLLRERRQQRDYCCNCKHKHCMIQNNARYALILLLRSYILQMQVHESCTRTQAATKPVFNGGLCYFTLPASCLVTGSYF